MSDQAWGRPTEGNSPPDTKVSKKWGTHAGATHRHLCFVRARFTPHEEEKQNNGPSSGGGVPEEGEMQLMWSDCELVAWGLFQDEEDVCLTSVEMMV